MRKDGYVKVTELVSPFKAVSQECSQSPQLSLPTFHSLDFITLERVVAKDSKKRYTLMYGPETSGAESIWWIRANQGHSIKVPFIQTS